MHRLLMLAAGFFVLAACSPHQVRVTQVRQQEATVLAPEVPLGIGAPLPSGGSSLSLGAGLTGVQQLDGDVGQQVIPVSGGIRGATAASDGVEVVASGTLGSANIDPGPLAQAVDNRSGTLGRGTLGIRTFLPLQSPIQWGLSFDVGAEWSHLYQLDTVTTDTRDPFQSTHETVLTDSERIRVTPHARAATLVRMPLPSLGPISALGGVQLATWPTYWRERTEVETCTTQFTVTSCATEGDVDVRPSTAAAVVTPTVGASLGLGTATLHAQAFTHLGQATAIDAVPWGGMVVLEIR